MEVPSGAFGFGLPFLVVLTVLVFVHELGHYLIARWNGVRVEVFSIGFGPEIFGRTDRAGTRWKFSLIPLGGYVKMFGDADAASRPDQGAADMTPEERAQAFQCKRLGQRSAIVAGGPLANFLFAIVLMAGLFVVVGQPYTPAVVGEILEGSAAEAAGFQPGDRIVRIDSRGIDRFEEVQQVVALSPGEELVVTVLRDGVEMVLPVVPELIELEDGFGNQQRIGRLGISRSSVEFTKHGPVVAVWYAAEETFFLTVDTLKALGQMIAGTRSAEELRGPLGIAKMAGQVAEVGIVSTIRFMALLSVALGLINLFPIPMLDGGHLLFYAIEAVRGRPLGEKAQEYGFRIGIALVLSLMLFATWNDIVHHLKIVEFFKGIVT